MYKGKYIPATQRPIRRFMSARRHCTININQCTASRRSQRECGTLRDYVYIGLVCTRTYCKRYEFLSSELSRLLYNTIQSGIFRQLTICNSERYFEGVMVRNGCLYDLARCSYFFFNADAYCNAPL